MKKHEGDRRHQVVVIGSGFGGLSATKTMKHTDVEVTMIAKTTHHLFQPLLYQVATGILSEGEVAPASREILSRQRNARVILGEVTHIDLANRLVTSRVLDRTTVTPYDSLIVAAGAGPSYFGHDQFAQYAPGLKSIDDALELRGRILGAFEMAENSVDDDDVDRLLTFAVVGGGPTGVEMAGQIAELARRTLKRDFRRINTRQARVLLIDAGPHLLPAFGAEAGRRTQQDLERIGVEVHLNSTVLAVDDRGLVVQDKDGGHRRIEAVTKVWAAGVAASPLGKILAEQTGARLDRSGRVAANADLTLPGHPEVFVVGDMVALDGLPGVAQAAIQSGKYAARQIRSRVHGNPPLTDFRYLDLGSMATISRFRAVAVFGRIRVTGLVAWLMWLALHLVYLTGFKNRVTALLHWTVSFIGRGRSERTVTQQQIFARAALSRLATDPARLRESPETSDARLGPDWKAELLHHEHYEAKQRGVHAGKGQERKPSRPAEVPALRRTAAHCVSPVPPP